VHVNNKPQYLVLQGLFGHLSSKHSHLPVESSKRPCAARTFAVDFAPNAVHCPGLPAGSRPIHKGRPLPVAEQDAETVQFGVEPVRIVDIWAAKRTTAQIPLEAVPPSQSKMRLYGQHLLVQDAHDADSVWLQLVKDDVLPMLVPLEPRPDCIASPPQAWVFGKALEKGLQTLSVLDSLSGSPSLKRVPCDGAQVGLRGSGDTELRQSPQPFPPLAHRYKRRASQKHPPPRLRC